MFDTTKVQNSIQLMTEILICLVLVQTSYLPEAAHLGLHYPDKYNYVDVFDFNVWYHKSSKVNSNQDLDSYLIIAGPEE